MEHDVLIDAMTPAGPAPSATRRVCRLRRRRDPPNACSPDSCVVLKCTQGMFQMMAFPEETHARAAAPAARRGVCDDAAARAPREDGRGRSHRRDDVHVGRAIDGVVEEATSGKPAPPVMKSIHSHCLTVEVDGT